MRVDLVELRENPRLFKTKKAPKNSRHAMGVDPVELRENPRASAKKFLFSKVKGIKKAPNISGLDVDVDPVELREIPRLFKTKKASKNSRLDVGVEGFEPPTLCL